MAVFIYTAGQQLLAAQVNNSVAELGALSLGCFYAGTPTATLLIFQYVAPFPLTIPANLVGTQSYAATAATASAAFTLKHNGTTAATMTFAAAGQTASSSTEATINLAIGDLLQLYAPTTVDITLADISIMFLMNRA